MNVDQLEGNLINAKRLNYNLFIGEHLDTRSIREIKSKS